METPTIGSRTLCIIRAHEKASDLGYSSTSCYAICIAAAEGVVTSTRIADGAQLHLNSAGTALKSLAKQGIFRTEIVKHGKTTRPEYFLTEAGKSLAEELMS